MSSDSQVEEIPSRQRPYKMFVWTDHISFLAVAHAQSIAEARELVLKQTSLGESGDGSCPEHDKAREFILTIQPTIWHGPNAEFAITDSATVRELEADLESVQKKLKQAIGCL